MFCKKCGKTLDDGANFCPYCGQKVNDDTLSSSNVSAEATKKATKASYTFEIGWAILGFLIPLVGLILYLVWKNDEPSKGISCGKGALVSVIASIAISIITFIVSLILAGSGALY